MYFCINVAGMESPLRTHTHTQHRTERYAFLTWATRVQAFWSFNFKVTQLRHPVLKFFDLKYFKFYDHLRTTNTSRLWVSFLSSILCKHWLVFQFLLSMFWLVFIIFYLSFLRWAFQYLGAINIPDTNPGHQLFL